MNLIEKMNASKEKETVQILLVELFEIFKEKVAEINSLKAQIIDQGQRFNDQSQTVRDLEHWNKNQYQLIKQNESNYQSLQHLLQKLIDDQYTTMRPSMAYEIQKALRGEHD